MPLQKQHITVPFAAGLDEKSTPQLLQDGFQASIINGVFDKNGSIRKRYGTRKLGTSPASPPFKLNTFQGELVATSSDSTLSAYSTVPFQSQNWIARNVTSEMVATRIGLPSLETGVRAYDINVSGNLACIAWIAVGITGVDTLFAQIIDLTSNTAVRPVSTFTGGGAAQSCPKVVFSTTGNGTFVVLWAEAGAGELWASKIVTNNVGAWSAPVRLRTDMATGKFDAAVLGGVGNRAVVFFESNVGNPLACLLLDTTTPSIAAAVQNPTVDAAYTGVAVGRQHTTADGSVWLAYSIVVGGGTSTRSFGVNPATMALNVAINIALVNVGWTSSTRIGLVRTGVGTAMIMMGTIPGGGVETTSVVAYVPTTNNVPTVAQTDTRRIQITSAPLFTSNGRLYFTGFFLGSGVSGASNTKQCTGWLFEITKLGNAAGVRAVATYAPLVCTSNQNATAAGTYQQTANLCVSPVTGQYVSLTDANIQNNHTTLQMAVFDTSPAKLQIGVELGHNLSLGGGVPSYYDGANVPEIGFLWFPENAVYTPGGAGTGSMADGIYQYQLVYEWYDAQGQYHQSAPSAATQVTVNTGGANTGSVAISFPTLNITQREATSRVGLAVYRAAPGATVHHRVTPDDVPVGNLNNALADFVVITDTASTASIATNRAIYTDSGAQQKLLPPSSSAPCLHRDRLWLAGGDDPNAVWFSGAVSEGDALWFSPLFIQRFDEPIVALASMDGRLLAFSRYSIFVVDGDGPSDAGTGSDLTQPQRVNSPSGCIDARSVVRIADGVLFQSEGGIYKVSRSLEVDYYGKNVEDTVLANPTLSSAVVLEEMGEQRWTASNGSTGLVLVYDDVQNAWTTFKYKDVTSAPFTPIAAVKWGSNGYAFAGSDGAVYLEDQATHKDAGAAFVPLTIVSNWFKPQANQGFGRFWRVTALLQGLTDHDLTISLAYNYKSTPVDVRTWQVIANGPLDPGGNESLSVKPTRQKCESMQVTLTDAVPTAPDSGVGIGTGYYAICLDFEVGMKQGNYKLPAIARL